MSFSGEEKPVISARALLAEISLLPSGEDAKIPMGASIKRSGGRCGSFLQQWVLFFSDTSFRGINGSVFMIAFIPYSNFVKPATI
jgi:hypothetical protein